MQVIQEPISTEWLGITEKCAILKTIGGLSNDKMKYLTHYIFPYLYIHKIVQELEKRRTKPFKRLYR